MQPHSIVLQLLKAILIPTCYELRLNLLFPITHKPAFSTCTTCIKRITQRFSPPNLDLNVLLQDLLEEYSTYDIGIWMLKLKLHYKIW